MWPKFYFAPDDPGGTGGESDDDPGDEPDRQSQEDPGSGDKNLVPRDELSKVNREAAKYRRERNDLQRRLKEIEDAEKDEVVKLTEQVSSLQNDLARTTTRNRILRVQVLAEKVGIAREARPDAGRLLDWDSLEDPDSDSILEEALRNLVKDRPYLRGAGGGADGGAGTGGRSQGAGMNELIRASAGRR